MPGAGRSAKQGTRGCEKKGRVCQTCDSSGGSSRVCSSAKPGQDQVRDKGELYLPRKQLYIEEVIDMRGRKSRVSSQAKKKRTLSKEIEKKIGQTGKKIQLISFQE
ncbi:Titin [Manis pentadactyla]|nr:Titin [Manis pentadactyla]